MIDLIEALEDMLAESPRDVTQATVLRREYPREANDLPLLTDDEALQSVVADCLHDDFVSQAIQGDRENA
jgi:hypothetical protein